MTLPFQVDPHVVSVRVRISLSLSLNFSRPLKHVRNFVENRRSSLDFLTFPLVFANFTADLLSWPNREILSCVYQPKKADC